MSYSFTVTAKDGAVEVGPPNGPVPDGTYQVNGHDGEASRTISITRSDGFHQVAQAIANVRRD